MTPVMATPVQKAGFKIGDKFRVNVKTDGFEPGTIIELIEDDGTNYPKFEGPNPLYRLGRHGTQGAFARLDCLTKLEAFKIGDRVKIVRIAIADGFEEWNRGKIGTISHIDGSSLPVRVDFEDGDDDWGKFEELELFVELDTHTVKQKLAQIAKLTAEVQELLG